MVLAGAGVLGLLDDDDLVLVHLAGQGDGGGQAGVAGRAALQAFELGEQLGHVEDFALGDELVFIHVAQRAGGVARHIHPVRPGGEGHAKTGMPGGEGFAVEIAVGGHVQPGQIDRAGHDPGVLAAGCQQARAPCRSGCRRRRG